ncbi:ADP-ribosylglycohydrolase family protein [Microbacterium sp. NPDC019599]|uniref:ADP-ribosylglycohydrolase family protein n=1 Tax=Microbacterium sp. NPDC019599 TaxID=3154690 RepID=UPI0033BFE5C6
MRLTWAQPEDLVAAEITALREQGAAEAVLASVEERWIAAGGDPVLQPAGASAVPAPPALRAFARELLDELAAAQPASDEEPDDWESIEALLPPAPQLPRPRRIESDRVRGAWYGRAVGCLLGKPVEKIPRAGIEEIARATGNWPITGYFTAQGLPPDVAARWPWNRRSAPTSLVENIAGMPEDDDLNFALLALDMVEGRGSALTTEDVAEAWLASLPAGRVFTAERAAYRNLLDARPVPDTATHHNPFREWIGALIRVDVYGWAHPGDVRSAARLAWTDARLSHTRNGLYGAMWAAALCSASLVAASPAEALDAADAVVPPGSRLAAAVALGRRAGADRAAGTIDDAQALDRLHAELGSLHWVHTLNNAALIACALEASGGSVGRGIAIAVAGGWDTDSAGATVGSVLGGLGGLSGIDAAWTAPLDGRIATSLPGSASRSIEELAQRTLRLPARMSL